MVIRIYLRSESECGTAQASHIYHSFIVSAQDLTGGSSG